MKNPYEINIRRMIAEFQTLAAFDSESFGEAEIAAYLEKKLKSLGLEVERDRAGEKLRERLPKEAKTASNLYGYLKGNAPGEPMVFSSHMDTVSPGKGKKVVIHEDGTITSDGSSVLGADDISGLVSILEALTVIQEQKLQHPDIEVFFTVAEEPYCEGSRHAEYEKLKAKRGYVLDLVGPIGRAATAAPSIFSLAIHIKGRAAHAGFVPEEGINALNIAVDALSKLPTGHTGEDTTLNFGTIRGGTGKNIVPEEVFLEGEVRSLVHEKALGEIDKVRDSFQKAAHKLGGEVKLTVTEHIRAYRVEENEKVVRRFVRAAGGIERCIPAECITTFGGSDANRLNEHGIKTIVLACGMENCHSRTEYTRLEELKKAAELTLLLMTMED